MILPEPMPLMFIPAPGFLHLGPTEVMKAGLLFGWFRGRPGHRTPVFFPGGIPAWDLGGSHPKPGGSGGRELPSEETSQKTRLGSRDAFKAVVLEASTLVHFDSERQKFGS